MYREIINNLVKTIYLKALSECDTLCAVSILQMYNSKTNFVSKMNFFSSCNLIKLIIHTHHSISLS